MNPIDHVLHEERLFAPSASFVAQAHINSMSQYEALCHKAKTNPMEFWGDLAKDHIVWHRPFDQVLDESNAPFYRWFVGGQTNVTVHCLDQQIANGNGEKTALIFEADDGQVRQVTYQELLQMVCQLSNGLKSLGLVAGDRVIIYMPMSIEGVVAMHACARLGIIHSVVFGGFSAKSIQERIIDATAKAVITANYQLRGGKELPLKAIVDQALELGGCEHIEHVIVYERTTTECSMQTGKDIWLHELVQNQPLVCDPVWVDAEHPLFILYTSGSTGKPKGVQHSTAGYLLWARLTMQWTFDIKPTDVFWCTADIGWITGHTYVAYGPLSMGTTVLLFEGVPTYPDAGRFWSNIQKHRVTIFHTAPTAIRSLIKASEQNHQVHPNCYDLSSLRLLGSVGEPINPEAWMWYYENIGKKQCPILDTFWQTETGGNMIAPMPGAFPLQPGSCTLPLPGIEAAIVDETGQDVPDGQGGLLVIKRPWPSMIRTIWRDPERFAKSYYPTELGGRFYLAGDGAVRDPKTRYFTIIGRIDDVLNVSGHRLGTMEVESALVAHDCVAEAAVVGRPDATTGEAIVAFVVLKGSRPEGQAAKEMVESLRQWVAKEIGPIAKPHDIRFGDNLPKTRSGKIMRRLLRSIAKGEAITQDLSTLENPAILDQFQQIGH